MWVYAYIHVSSLKMRSRLQFYLFLYEMEFFIFCKHPMDRHFLYSYLGAENLMPISYYGGGKQGLQHQYQMVWDLPPGQYIYISTGWHKKNAANFQLKKAWFYFRSTFLKFCMQVQMASNITYIKSKKPPRLACGHQPPRRVGDDMGTEAHDYIFSRKNVGNFPK